MAQQKTCDKAGAGGEHFAGVRDSYAMFAYRQRFLRQRCTLAAQFQPRGIPMKYRSPINYILSAVILLAPMTLRADMVDTPMLLNHEMRSTQVELIETYLAQEEVLLQMEAMVVSPVLAADRVASLTDAQLQQLAINVQDAPAGGALGVVIAVLVIVLLREILGITNISSKV